jgi:HSP20 family molecular chaperone IbpA
VKQPVRHCTLVQKFAAKNKIRSIWALAETGGSITRRAQIISGCAAPALAGIGGRDDGAALLDCGFALSQISWRATGAERASRPVSLGVEEKCMSRLSLFNSPLLLGFDHFERALDRVSKVSADGYPPYNVEQLGENALRITLAVAGFQMNDLGITVEDNQLVVRGRQTDDTQRVYLHRGIAARQFQRSFVLAEGIEVSGAWLDNGLLHIDLVRPEAESRVRNVEIRKASTATKRELVDSGS